MTSSSGSTNRTFPVLAGLLLCGGLFVCGGCASRPKAAPPTVYGYADLNALVRRQPGWSGLAQYDAALSRLDLEARSLPPLGQPDPKMAVLPALTLGTGPGATPGAKDVSEIGQHLSFVQQSLIGSLNDRRSLARADQLRRQQELWRREARRLYPVPARTAAVTSDLSLQLLQANVAALTQTLNHWDSSKPPAPALNRLRLKVEADRQRLEDLIAGILATRTAARAARSEAVQRMREARAGYVQSQGDLLTARLEADDTRVLDAQKQRLSDQRLVLLAALARPEPVSVAAAGNAGALTLPQGPDAARASLSAASLAAARTRLSAQRRRWLRYLSDDTRASALDAAAQRHWNITFGPPRRGDKDMTDDLESVLASKQ